MKILFPVFAVLLLAACLLFGSSGIGFPDLATSAGAAILKLRVYRVAAGFVVGAGLSCSGLILQALLRNPLAEPYVLGVSGGAGLGAAVAILTGIAGISAFLLPLTAFLFGLMSLVLVYSLAGAGGRLSIYSLILSGIIVSSVCSSLLMFMVSIAPVEGLHSVIWWMLGNLDISEPSVFHVSALFVLAACAIAVLLARDLNAMSLGREMAHNVGVKTKSVLAAGLLASTIAASACVGVSGLIGFVGLIVPHAVRGVVGPDHRRLIPYALFYGGVFLSVCDALARTMLLPLGPYEVPVGVVTALIGGPFFIMILYKKRRRGWIE